MTIAKLQELQKAYEWEQTRILAWIDDLNQHSFADNDKIPSAVVKRFYEIWIDYFKEIRASNQKAIEICTEAIKIGTPESATQAIKDIDAFHEKDPLVQIRDVAITNSDKVKSRYFQSIKEGLNLEVTARNYIIEEFLAKP